MAALAKAGVIQPWPLTFKAGQEDKPVTGLHHIDELALNKLTDDSFLGFARRQGAADCVCANVLGRSAWAFPAPRQGAGANWHHHLLEPCRKTSITSLSCPPTI